MIKNKMIKMILMLGVFCGAEAPIPAISVPFNPLSTQVAPRVDATVDEILDLAGTSHLLIFNMVRLCGEKFSIWDSIALARMDEKWKGRAMLLCDSLAYNQLRDSKPLIERVLSDSTHRELLIDSCKKAMTIGPVTDFISFFTIFPELKEAIGADAVDSYTKLEQEEYNQGMQSAEKTYNANKDIIYNTDKNITDEDIEDKKITDEERDRRYYARAHARYMDSQWLDSYKKSCP